MQLISQNKKAHWNYEVLKTYTAGIVLKGSEVKSIRAKNVNLNDAYARFLGHELFVINMHISLYKGSQLTVFNHEPTASRKLLLNQKELALLYSKTREKGYTIVPLKLFINARNLVKIEIAMVRGKKEYDKRSVLKDRETQKVQARELKQWVAKKRL